MQPEALFGKVLGIAPPWEVTEVNFSKESNRLDITVGFQHGSTIDALAKAYDLITC